MTGKKRANVLLRFKTQSAVETVRRAARLADQSVNKWGTARLLRLAEEELTRQQQNQTSAAD